MLDEIPGLQNKVFINIPYVGMNVYDLPGLIFDFQHSTYGLKRVNLEYSGEKYYVQTWQGSAWNGITVYNPNYTVWKTFNLPIGPNEQIKGIFHVSEGKIDPDNLLEICYSVSSNPSTLTPVTYTSYVINENGNILLSVPGHEEIKLSEFPGKQNKLITKREGPFNVLSRIVFGLPTFGIDGINEINVKEGNVTIYPNPSSGNVFLKSGSSINKVEINSIDGKLLYKEERLGTDHLNLKDMRSGIYSVRVMTEDGGVCVKKLVVN